MQLFRLYSFPKNGGALKGEDMGIKKWGKEISFVYDP
jgi:hypothetical protein